MKNSTLIFLIAGVVGVLAIIAYIFIQNPSALQGPEEENTITQPEPQEQQEEEPQEESKPETILGSSVEGTEITAYHYGQGARELLFVGGFHGGYSWNTVLLAYELMDYLADNPNVIPNNIQVTVIPVLNPDGLQKVMGTAGRFTEAQVPSSLEATIPARFNAHNVDLNRNFDCDWQPTGMWQTRSVSGGKAPFSEPESQALRDYVENQHPDAVVMWYSAAGGVFASACNTNDILPETRTLMNAYASASGYPAYDKFEFYEITGDAANWLAKNNIPAFSVLLSNHEDIEWRKNRAGIEALMQYYAE